MFMVDAGWSVPALRFLGVMERLAEVFDNYAVALQHKIQWPPRIYLFIYFILFKHLFTAGIDVSQS